MQLPWKGSRHRRMLAKGCWHVVSDVDPQLRKVELPERRERSIPCHYPGLSP